ncbi:uncharacterized protein G2W53_007756 [Senna tora]|uniref:Uncharacterized protein n=1 Tax=Senna tora TaxID=362788 RepID=A0A834X704_9FABA|nr:uncharacterized protein G2W53_007756 [Senna tora]
MRLHSSTDTRRETKTQGLKLFQIRGLSLHSSTELSTSEWRSETERDGAERRSLCRPRRDPKRHHRRLLRSGSDEAWCDKNPKKRRRRRRRRKTILIQIRTLFGASNFKLRRISSNLVNLTRIEFMLI